MLAFFHFYVLKNYGISFAILIIFNCMLLSTSKPERFQRNCEEKRDIFIIWIANHPDNLLLKEIPIHSNYAYIANLLLRNDCVNLKLINTAAKQMTMLRKTVDFGTLFRLIHNVYTYTQLNTLEIAHDVLNGLSHSSEKVLFLFDMFGITVQNGDSFMEKLQSEGVKIVIATGHGLFVKKTFAWLPKHRLIYLSHSHLYENYLRNSQVKNIVDLLRQPNFSRFEFSRLLNLNGIDSPCLGNETLVLWFNFLGKIGPPYVNDVVLQLLECIHGKISSLRNGIKLVVNILSRSTYAKEYFSYFDEKYNDVDINVFSKASFIRRDKRYQRSIHVLFDSPLHDEQQHRLLNAMTILSNYVFIEVIASDTSFNEKQQPLKMSGKQIFIAFDDLLSRYFLDSLGSQVNRLARKQQC